MADWRCLFLTFLDGTAVRYSGKKLEHCVKSHYVYGTFIATSYGCSSQYDFFNVLLCKNALHSAPFRDLTRRAHSKAHTKNPRFKPRGLIDFMVHNHVGSNRERVEIET